MVFQFTGEQRSLRALARGFCKRKSARLIDQYVPIGYDS